MMPTLFENERLRSQFPQIALEEYGMRSNPSEEYVFQVSTVQSLCQVLDPAVSTTIHADAHKRIAGFVELWWVAKRP